MIHFVAPRDLCGIEPFLRLWRQSDHPQISIHAYEDVFESSQLPAGTWVFMGVRQLPAAGQRLAEAVWDTLTGAGQKVLNRPSALVSRLELLEMLHSAGVNSFCAFRPDEIENVRGYPGSWSEWGNRLDTPIE